METQIAMTKTEIVLTLTMTEEQAKRWASERLAYLRGEIQAERISYSELGELQTLIPFIDPGDVLLLEWAGVPEKA